MGTSTSTLPSAGSTERTHGDRFNGNPLEQQATTIHLLLSRCTSFGSEHPSLGLEPVVSSLPVSTQVVHSKDNIQTTMLQESRDCNTSVVSSVTMVPLHFESSSAILASASTRSNEEWTTRLREVDRVQFLKEVFTSSLGNTVASHLISAHRDSTIRQAQSIWKAFQKWLPVSTRTISTQTLMEFLIACEENRHLDPRTILNYRSQLRLPILQAFGIDLSTENFSLLARSQFLRNPPTKQKIPQWSIERALETFSSEEFSFQKISLTDLLLKTLFLTALASGNRASELAATVRTGISLTYERAVLPTEPGFLFKNQSTRNPKPPDITFPGIGQDNPLCPIESLRVYITRTESIAKNKLPFCPSLHREVSKCRATILLACQSNQKRGP